MVLPSVARTFARRNASPKAREGQKASHAKVYKAINQFCGLAATATAAKIRPTKAAQQANKAIVKGAARLSEYTATQSPPASVRSTIWLSRS
jgi:hypothetical protein